MIQSTTIFVRIFGGNGCGAEENKGKTIDADILKCIRKVVGNLFFLCNVNRVVFLQNKKLKYLI